MKCHFINAVSPLTDNIYVICFQGVCTEAGMYALRERRVHVTQEDFELAVAKVGCSIMDIADRLSIKMTCDAYCGLCHVSAYTICCNHFNCHLCGFKHWKIPHYIYLIN